MLCFKIFNILINGGEFILTNNVVMKSEVPFTRDNVISINDRKVSGSKSINDIQSINNGYSSNQNATVTARPVAASSPMPQQSASVSNNSPIPQQSATVTSKPVPALINPARKGQKVNLFAEGQIPKVCAKLGFNVLNNACDVDVSAFLLDASGKVLGDDWFVFYGQETSPDSSTVFSMDNGTDRENISIDFTKLNPSVSKIVFVLTINEALENNLNFSMLKDAYIRIMNTSNNTELVSFMMDEYYSNVTSMMIGEIYKNNGNWKFNAIGNGVAKDLAGLCELYGVNVQ